MRNLTSAAAAQDNPQRATRPRKGFAAHLEWVEIIIEPDIPAGCEGLEKVLIGEDVSERLDVMLAKFRVILTRHPKYASIEASSNGLDGSPGTVNQRQSWLLAS